MKIVHLPDPESHPVWPDIKELLTPAARRGGIEPYSEGDVLWLAVEGGTVYAAMVTKFCNETAEIICLAGTRMTDWLPDWARIFEEYGRAAGAVMLECRGRKGWARYAERFGWVFSHNDDGVPVYTKDLR